VKAQLPTYPATRRERLPEPARAS